MTHVGDALVLDRDHAVIVELAADKGSREVRSASQADLSQTVGYPGRAGNHYVRSDDRIVRDDGELTPLWPDCRSHVLVTKKLHIGEQFSSIRTKEGLTRLSAENHIMNRPRGRDESR